MKDIEATLNSITDDKVKILDISNN